MFKKRLLSFTTKYQLIQIFLNFLCLLLCVIVILKGNREKSFLYDFIDVSVFSGFIGVTLINIAAQAIEKCLASKVEDAIKLTTDYNKLINTYNIPAAEHKTSDDEINQLVTRENISGEKIVLPVIYVCNLYHCQICIQDSQNQYQLPEVIQDHFDELMNASKTSVVYNQLNVRVDSWHWDKQERNFAIHTSRTEYFKSLVTNRAMDYQWKNGLTVRSCLDYGPFVRTLEESQLSNHLGFNGFIESSDGMIMFVKRGSHLSIGKNTYGTSVGASLKAKYAITDGVFTEEGLRKAICCEIKDECKIEVKTESFFLEEHLIAAYRDMVEGGKPQFLFFLHHDTMTKAMIERNFKRNTENVKKKSSVLEDGFHFLWLTHEEFRNVELGVDYMLYHNKKYPMTPSTVASVIILQNHFMKYEELNGDY